jgi:hypothetical protein
MLSKSSAGYAPNEVTHLVGQCAPRGAELLVRGRIILVVPLSGVRWADTFALKLSSSVFESADCAGKGLELFLS